MKTILIACIALGLFGCNSNDQEREARGAGIGGTLAPMPTGSIKKAYTPLNVLPRTDQDQKKGSEQK